MKTYQLPEGVSAADAVKRIVYLAWKASQMVGMGFLQNRGEISEDEVFAQAVDEADYSKAMLNNTPLSVYCDYVTGRMMKLRVKGDQKANTIELADDTPRLDYQSWGRTYKSYEDLYETAILSLLEESEATSENGESTSTGEA